jgi:hypothetical protein
MAYQDKFVQVDDLQTRDIEDGSGPAVICLHVAFLGSSAGTHVAASCRATLPVDRDVRQERSRHAYEPAGLLKEKYPQLDLHIVGNCKHLVQGDAMNQFHRLAARFLPN